MYIKLELLKRYIADFINNGIENFEIDANEVANTVAIEMLAEIQSIICDDKNSDFDAIEKIVCVFEKYDIDAGCRHDF